MVPIQENDRIFLREEIEKLAYRRICAWQYTKKARLFVAGIWTIPRLDNNVDGYIIVSHV